MKKRQTGFTLIEIAIVLVIIGLLLGGVLKGQEMINNSKIRNTITSMDGIAAAIYSYQDRYKALPGDDPNANGRWGVTSGDGNGVIDGAWTDPDAAGSETAAVWEHLRHAGLITGAATIDANPVAFPTHPFNGAFGVETAGSATAAGATNLVSGIVICMNNVEAKFGEILDRNLDDGDGTLGDMRNDGPDAVYDVQADAVYIVCRRL